MSSSSTHMQSHQNKIFFYTVLQIPFSSLLRLKFILSPTFFDIQFLNWFFSLKFFHLFLFTQLSSPLGLDPQPCPLVWVLIAWVETHSLLTDKSIQTGSLWSLWWLKGIQSNFTYRTTLECFRILLKAFQDLQSILDALAPNFIMIRCWFKELVMSSSLVVRYFKVIYI